VLYCAAIQGEIKILITTMAIADFDALVGHLSPIHTSNNVETTYDFVERIVRAVAFDSVTSTLLLVWTGLYTHGCSHRRES